MDLLRSLGILLNDHSSKLQVGGVEMYIDLGAEKIIAAEKDGRKNSR